MNLKELKKLNFEELINIGVSDASSYNFNDYRRNGYEHKPIEGYCISCDTKNINHATNDSTYKLTNISHGSHSLDFLDALKQPVDITNWHDEPVMFVYESPSLDYGIYKDITFNGHSKRPSKEWYWIHDDQELTFYPDRFTGGEYGGFVVSAICTFRLAGAYMTNLVKCGMNNDDGNFKGISSYPKACIENCYNHFLSKEIELIKPKIIFAVGSAVEEWVKYLVPSSCYVQQLPHPAGRRRGFRDEHYKVLYFWLVTNALYKTGIIDMDESKNLSELFLTNFYQNNSS